MHADPIIDNHPIPLLPTKIEAEFIRDLDRPSYTRSIEATAVRMPNGRGRIVAFILPASIGGNDLIEEALAAGRSVPKVSPSKTCTTSIA